MSEEQAIKRIVQIITDIQNTETSNMVIFNFDNDPDEAVMRLSVVWEFERSKK